MNRMTNRKAHIYGQLMLQAAVLYESYKRISQKDQKKILRRMLDNILELLPEKQVSDARRVIRLKSQLKEVNHVQGG